MGNNEDNVGFALDAVGSKQYESICNTEDGRILLRVLRVVEDVVPVFSLFAKARWQSFFWFSFVKPSI